MALRCGSRSFSPPSARAGGGVVGDKMIRALLTCNDSAPHESARPSAALTPGAADLW
jgi:hypothetical protein